MHVVLFGFASSLLKLVVLFEQMLNMKWVSLATLSEYEILYIYIIILSAIIGFFVTWL